MAEKKIPEALFEGELKIGDASIPCAVLEDGTRVLTQAGMLQALGRSRKPSGKSLTADQLPPFLAPKNLEPFIDGDLRRSTIPILFKPLKTGGLGGNQAYGYNAEILPRVCEVMLQARDANALQTRQLHAYREKRLVDGLNGRTWDAIAHLEAEHLVAECEAALSGEEVDDG